jgi:hypothetical protein
VIEIPREFFPDFSEKPVLNSLELPSPQHLSMRLVILKLRRQEIHNGTFHPILHILHTRLSNPQIQLFQLLIKPLLITPTTHPF